jgi:putative spermidine/putrescine transport system ATP-binding protein
VQKQTGLTMIFVTHDQGEALALADEIVVMNAGVIEQIGTPEEIYNKPKSGFVADFVGFENIFGVKDGKLQTKEGLVELSGSLAKEAAGLAWRPNKILLGEGAFNGEVIASSFTGDSREYVLQTSIGEIKAEVQAQNVFDIGSQLSFDLPVDGAAILQRV